jgi:hypothetical protein
MPDKRIRFGVRDDHGRRASTWTLLALRISAERPEVYPPHFGEIPQGQLRYFSGRGPADIMETEYLRALAPATDSLGIHILLDAPVEIAS